MTPMGMFGTCGNVETILGTLTCRRNVCGGQKPGRRIGQKARSTQVVGIRI